VGEQPNWKMILPAAAMAGFVLTGFWGLLLGPIAAVPVVSWRRRRDGAEPAGDEERRLADFMAETLVASRSKTPAPKPPATETVKPGPGEARTGAARPGEAGLFDSFAAARLALIENSRDAQAAATMARLAKKIAPGEPLTDLRQRTAAQAIELCLANGQAAAAAGVFAEYLDERAGLRLPPAQWEALGRALLGEGNFMASAWALHAGALLAGDAAGAQKRLVEVADKASAAGQPAAAVRLYRTLLGKYPDSPYAQFARENMKTEERRLVTSRDTSGRG
jgi:TolA-binding protein